MKKIRKRCKCGCGEITNPGRKYINGHNQRGKKLSDKTKAKISDSWQHRVVSAETKRKMSEAAQNMSEEHKLNLSKALQGRKLSAEHKRKISKSHQGKKQTAEHILNSSLARMKFDPDNPYCDVWKSKEYKKDIKKDYCENVDCKKDYKKLGNHHIYLDKKRCAPIDIMTMCNPCHSILHRKLERGKHIPADPKDYIIINRPDHASYIHKKSRTVIRIRRIV